MNCKKLITATIRIALVCTLLLVGCNEISTLPTLTFTVNGCAYDGPDNVDEVFDLDWIVQESDHPGFVYAVVTLDPGKSVEDLASIPAEDPAPTWVHKLSYDSALSPGTYHKSLDLSTNAAFREGPIYIVCIFTDEARAIGAVGPIKVRQ